MTGKYAHLQNTTMNSQLLGVILQRTDLSYTAILSGHKTKGACDVI